MKKPPRRALSALDDEAAPLTDQQERFCQRYVATLHGTKAAMDAGYKPRAAAAQASRLLTKRKIQARLAELAAGVAERNAFDADRLLGQWVAIATADPRELVEYQRRCCRYCYGRGFCYQETPAEHAKRSREYERRDAERIACDGPPAVEFDALGGTGFDAKRAPHAGCPECFGEGIMAPIFHDTRTLSAQAAVLYEGVKITAQGFEVLTADKAAARDALAKWFDLFSGGKGADVSAMSDDELEEILVRRGRPMFGRA